MRSSSLRLFSLVAVSLLVGCFPPDLVRSTEGGAVDSAANEAATSDDAGTESGTGTDAENDVVDLDGQDSSIGNDAGDEADVAAAEVVVLDAEDSAATEAGPDAAPPDERLDVVPRDADAATEDADSGVIEDVVPDIMLPPDGGCPTGTTECANPLGGTLCANLQTDRLHCGSCARTCNPANNASPRCSSGTCGITCNANFGDCNMNTVDGCEVDLRTTTAHCGACMRACPATQVCVGGGCTCPTGRMLCGSTCIDTMNDNNNCGVCGRVCSGAFRCSGGVCVTCGAVGQACCTSGTTCTTAGSTCVSGSCACGTGLTSCAGSCVNFTTDRNNCGACGRVCPTPPNAAPTCASSTCSGACLSGYGDCDMNIATNGCETPLNTTQNCGGCGRVCVSRPNMVASCVTGTCSYTCVSGFGDCDGNVLNGCETPINTTTNCGSCGAACPARANATAVCVSGACSISCLRGFGDCDANAATGCEVDLTDNPSNCGTCGRRCLSPTRCCGTSCTTAICL